MKKMSDEVKEREKIRQMMEGFLESMLEIDIINRIAWVSKAVPLSDLRDVAIGYVIGMAFERLESYGQFVELLVGNKLVSEDYQNLYAVINEKLPKFIEKVERDFCE